MTTKTGISGKWRAPGGGMVKKTNWNSGEKGSPVSMSWAFLRLRGRLIVLS